MLNSVPTQELSFDHKLIFQTLLLLSILVELIKMGNINWALTLCYTLCGSEICILTHSSCLPKMQ